MTNKKMKQPNADNDFDTLGDKIQEVLDTAESEMTTLIDEYNTKYEEDYDAPQVETCDLSNLFVQLSEFCEDHI